MLPPAASAAGAAEGGVACGSGTITYAVAAADSTGGLRRVDVSYESNSLFAPDDESAAVQLTVDSISSSDAGATSADWTGVGAFDSSGAGIPPRPAATVSVALRPAADRTYTVALTCEELGGAYTPFPFHAAETATLEVRVAPSTPSTGANLAPVPDFEADPHAAYYTAGTGVFSWATDAARSGSRSLKLVAPGPAGALARWMSQTTRIAVTPGESYRVSAWMRTRDVSGQAALAATFYGGGYLPSTLAARRLSGSNDWTELTHTVTAPAGATNLRVEFRVYGAGTLWTDDVAVTAGAAGDGTAPTPPANEQAPPPPVRPNLAPFADFESDPRAAYYTAGSGSFLWASDAARSGSRSLKLTAWGRAGALARWMSQTTRISVTPGKSYRVSAWVRTRSVSGQAGVAATFYAGGYLPSTLAARRLSGTNDWTELTQTVTAPAGATHLRVEFRVYGAGTLWIDDASVVEE
jgi:hypothetical protein